MKCPVKKIECDAVLFAKENDIAIIDDNCSTCVAMRAYMLDGEEGIKLDWAKLRYDLIDAYALEQLAKVYTYGAEKYADENWRKGLSWKRVFSALMRHVWAFWRGEEVDAESGLPHLAHAAWNCFTLLNYSKYHRDKDDRFIEEE